MARVAAVMVLGAVVAVAVAAIVVVVVVVVVVVAVAAQSQGLPGACQGHQRGISDGISSSSRQSKWGLFLVICLARMYI